MVTAYHCTYYPGHDKIPCDHSDGKRLAILGHHTISHGSIDDSYYTIPIIDIIYPQGAPLSGSDNESHDFAVGILQYPATWSEKVQPICLPSQDQEFAGRIAVAAGWGRFEPAHVTPQHSPTLQVVRLTVSRRIFDHYKMLGTELKMNDENDFMDPCAGDSGIS